MRTYLELFTLIIIITCNLFAQDSTKVSDNTGSLILNITGFENDEGIAMIALSNSAEDYNSRKKPYIGAMQKIENKKIKWVFENLPFGIYAIKVFHDENKDKELNTNFLGIPSEDYGFSNNASGSFGPASWEDAKFQFNENSMNINIEVD